jgi:hypothetical protein
MAFTVSNTRIVQGVGSRIVTGTYTCTDATTGGDVDTGLSMVYAFVLTPKAAATSANAPVYNETLPTSNKITIVTTTGETGTWMAVGV